MNCPNCNNIISINDATSANTQTKLSDKNWYKLKGELPLICSRCNAKLKLKSSKEIKTKLTVILLMYVLLALISFYYSTVLFMFMVLFIAFSSTLLVNYAIHKYGELVHDNT